MDNAGFINPYNFFPLTEKKKLASHTGRDLTGVIEYSVLTKTPLFIPNTSCDRRFRFDPSTLSDEEKEAIADHKSYDFFSYERLNEGEEKCYKPVIPGSEIRGMFRNNYEILTESCLSAYDEHAVLSKRTMERFKPGLLRKNADGKYDLYKAESYPCPMIRAGRNGQKELTEGRPVRLIKNGYKMPIPVDRDIFNQGDGFGYMIKGEKGLRKYNHYIFTKTKDPVFRKNVGLETLERVLEEYERNNAGKYSEYRTQFAQFKDSQNEAAFPVYYSLIENDLMFSPACITREIYGTTMEEILRDFVKCSDKQALCPACALFGMVNKGTSAASRIRFTDLCAEERKDPKDYYLHPPVTLSPLSSPKINNMEFYFKQPAGAKFWTFAYYIDEQGELTRNVPEISGRKFYWHQINCELPEGVKKTNQNMTVRPVKKNVLFTGKLYFQDISREELDQLIWLLNAGDDEPLSNKRFGYKLGAAKPLGLGSIAVSVDRVYLRKTVIENGLVSRKNEEYPKSCGVRLFDETIVKNYRKMTDFNFVKGKNISYPIKLGQVKCGPVTEGYEWFGQNHKRYGPNKKIENKMPCGRVDMYYREHMVAMEPQLQLTCEEHEKKLNKTEKENEEHKEYKIWTHSRPKSNTYKR